MKPNLVPHWRHVLKRAWSLRLMELAALSDIILNLIPATADYLPWWVTLLLLALGWGARFIAQPDKEAANANQ